MSIYSGIDQSIQQSLTVGDTWDHPQLPNEVVFDLAMSPVLGLGQSTPSDFLYGLAYDLAQVEQMQPDPEPFAPTAPVPSPLQVPETEEYIPPDFERRGFISDLLGDRAPTRLEPNASDIIRARLIADGYLPGDTRIDGTFDAASRFALSEWNMDNQLKEMSGNRQTAIPFEKALKTVNDFADPQSLFSTIQAMDFWWDPDEIKNEWESWGDKFRTWNDDKFSVRNALALFGPIDDVVFPALNLVMLVTGVGAVAQGARAGYVGTRAGMAVSGAGRAGRLARATTAQSVAAGLTQTGRNLPLLGARIGQSGAATRMAGAGAQFTQRGGIAGRVGYQATRPVRAAGQMLTGDVAVLTRNITMGAEYGKLGSSFVTKAAAATSAITRGGIGQEAARRGLTAWRGWYGSQLAKKGVQQGLRIGASLAVQDLVSPNRAVAEERRQRKDELWEHSTFISPWRAVDFLFVPRQLFYAPGYKSARAAAAAQLPPTGLPVRPSGLPDTADVDDFGYGTVVEPETVVSRPTPGSNVGDDFGYGTVTVDDGPARIGGPEPVRPAPDLDEVSFGADPLPEPGIVGQQRRAFRQVLADSNIAESLKLVLGNFANANSNNPTARRWNDLVSKHTGRLGKTDWHGALVEFFSGQSLAVRFDMDNLADATPDPFAAVPAGLDDASSVGAATRQPRLTSVEPSRGVEIGGRFFEAEEIAGFNITSFVMAAAVQMRVESTLRNIGAVDDDWGNWAAWSKVFQNSFQDQLRVLSPEMFVGDQLEDVASNFARALAMAAVGEDMILPAGPSLNLATGAAKKKPAEIMGKMKEIFNAQLGRFQDGEGNWLQGDALERAVADAMDEVHQHNDAGRRLLEELFRDISTPEGVGYLMNYMLHPRNLDSIDNFSQYMYAHSLLETARVNNQIVVPKAGGTVSSPQFEGRNWAPVMEANSMAVRTQRQRPDPNSLVDRFNSDPAPSMQKLQVMRLSTPSKQQAQAVINRFDALNAALTVLKAYRRPNDDSSARVLGLLGRLEEARPSGKWSDYTNAEIKGLIDQVVEGLEPASGLGADAGGNLERKLRELIVGAQFIEETKGLDVLEASQGTTIIRNLMRDLNGLESFWDGLNISVPNGSALFDLEVGSLGDFEGAVEGLKRATGGGRIETVLGDRIDSLRKAESYIASEVDVPKEIRESLAELGYKPVTGVSFVNPGAVLDVSGPLGPVSKRVMAKQSLGFMFSGAGGRMAWQLQRIKMINHLMEQGMSEDEATKVRRALTDYLDNKKAGAVKDAPELASQEFLHRVGNLFTTPQNIYGLSERQVGLALRDAGIDLPEGVTTMGVVNALKTSAHVGMRVEGLPAIESWLRANNPFMAAMKAFSRFEGDPDKYGKLTKSGFSVRRAGLVAVTAGAGTLAFGGDPEDALMFGALGGAMGLGTGSGFNSRLASRAVLGVIAAQATGALTDNESLSIGAFATPFLMGANVPGSNALSRSLTTAARKLDVVTLGSEGLQRAARESRKLRGRTRKAVGLGVAGLAVDQAQSDRENLGTKDWVLLLAGGGPMVARSLKAGDELREYSLLADRYAYLRDMFRFSLSPFFDASRYSEALLLRTIGDMGGAQAQIGRKLRNPFRWKKNTVDDIGRDNWENYSSEFDRVALNKSPEAPGLSASDVDVIEQYMEPLGILGFSMRDYMVSTYSYMRQAGINPSVAYEKAVNLATYGTKGRSPAERSVNFVFFPFSFAKKMYTTLSRYMGDDLARVVLMNQSLQVLQDLEGRLDGGFQEWTQRHAPMLNQALRFNQFAFGISPGVFGGQNRPAIEMLVGTSQPLWSEQPQGSTIDQVNNFFLWQGVSLNDTSQVKTFTDFMDRLTPAVRDLERLQKDARETVYAVRSPSGLTRNAEAIEGLQALRELNDKYEGLARQAGYRDLDGMMRSNNARAIQIVKDAREAVLEDYPEARIQRAESAAWASQTQSDLSRMEYLRRQNLGGLTPEEQAAADFYAEMRRVSQLVGAPDDGLELSLGDPDRVSPQIREYFKRRALALAEADPRFLLMYRRYFRRWFGEIELSQDMRPATRAEVELARGVTRNAQ